MVARDFVREQSLELEEGSGSSSDSEELMLGAEASDIGRRPLALAATIGRLGMAACCVFALACWGHIMPNTQPRVQEPGTGDIMPGAQLRVPEPLTVRALLDGPELRDTITDNVMAVGGEQLKHSVTRDEVRVAVHRKLSNISDALREQLPQEHAKFDLIQLSAVQKDAVFKALRHYGDQRMVALSRAVLDSVQETSAEHGDEAAFQRRLMEKLQPRMRDVLSLGEVLFPARNGDGVDVNTGSGVNQWHMQVGMSQPQVGSQSVSARRLSAEDLTGGVTVQVRTMFGKLSDELGEEAGPRAPERMLHAQQQSERGEEGLMSCMMEAMGKMNIPGCVSCMFSHMQSVFKMVSKVLLGGGH